MINEINNMERFKKGLLKRLAKLKAPQPIVPLRGAKCCGKEMTREKNIYYVNGERKASVIYRCSVCGNKQTIILQ